MYASSINLTIEMTTILLRRVQWKCINVQSAFCSVSSINTKNESASKIKKPKEPRNQDSLKKWTQQQREVQSQLYNSNACAAFTSGDDKEGFRFLETIVESRLELVDNVYQSYWDFCKKTPNTKESIEKMFMFLQDKRILLSKTSADGLTLLLDQSNVKFKQTKINERGLCLNCENLLTTSKLSKSEFEELKQAFVNRVIKGDDSSKLMNMKEAKYLKHIVKSKKNFEFVIDALNVIYLSEKSFISVLEQAKLIHAVVLHFVKQNKKILLIGRKHMELFPENYKKYINQETTCILLNDNSLDDLYLLYAALLSGPKTKLLSRDMMTDNFALFEPRIRDIFRRWQQSNQVSFNIESNGCFQLMECDINIFPQKIKNIWHIPYVDSHYIKYSIFRKPDNWLCTKLNCD